MMENVVGVSESPFTFEQQVYQHAGQRWLLSVRLNPLGRLDGDPWRAWLASLMGRYGTFVIGDPTAMTPKGTPKPAIVALSGQTGNAITFTSSGGVAEFLKPGDYVQLGETAAAPRLHQVLNTVTTSSNGIGIADIWPRIRTIPNSGDPMYVAGCVGTFRLDDNSVTEEIVPTGYYIISFSAREAL